MFSTELESLETKLKSAGKKVIHMNSPAIMHEDEVFLAKQKLYGSERAFLEEDEISKAKIVFLYEIVEVDGTKKIRYNAK